MNFIAAARAKMAETGKSFQQVAREMASKGGKRTAQKRQQQRERETRQRKMMEAQKLD